MLIAIHQPNWLPWLGYFHKIARADVFVFLEDVQFSKGSYTNRVGILLDGKQRWLTQPIKQKFGQSIQDLECSDPQWRRKHLSLLSNAYDGTPCFSKVFPAFVDWFDSIREDRLSKFNRLLTEAISNELGFSPKFVSDTELNVEAELADDRLIALVQSCSPSDARYLSGAGGRAYQDEEKFRAAGIGIEYTDFVHPTYDQGGAPFIPGLSIVDCLFRLGWQETAHLIRGQVEQTP